MTSSGPVMLQFRHPAVTGQAVRSVPSDERGGHIQLLLHKTPTLIHACQSDRCEATPWSGGVAGAMVLPAGHLPAVRRVVGQTGTPKTGGSSLSGDEDT
ncbi:hypothetical protein [Acetobacter oeni]|uniref:hypothetical protein n=1 Tax=Acetobacter oeni TaxID=304077 RepID=UPI001569A99B|nr:hypothetical protein [Acetobacter oeni]MBB3882911.1 hypothetical protein [Acetobacter oeni]